MATTVKRTDKTKKCQLRNPDGFFCIQFTGDNTNDLVEMGLDIDVREGITNVWFDRDTWDMVDLEPGDYILGHVDLPDTVDVMTKENFLSFYKVTEDE